MKTTFIRDIFGSKSVFQKKLLAVIIEDSTEDQRRSIDAYSSVNRTPYKFADVIANPSLISEAWALEMMSYTGLCVDDILEKVGFDPESYFQENPKAKEAFYATMQAEGCGPVGYRDRPEFPTDAAINLTACFAIFQELDHPPTDVLSPEIPF